VPTAAMKIGDLVVYQGRAYYLRGLDPMGVPDRRMILEDPETGKELTVPAADVEERSDDDGAPPPAGV
jgi:hypothetical protein